MMAGDESPMRIFLTNGVPLGYEAVRGREDEWLGAAGWARGAIGGEATTGCDSGGTDAEHVVVN